MEPYYYQRLSKPMQEAYHAIKRGVESLSPAFPVPRLEMEQLSEVLFYLRLDCPEIFYITNFSCRVHPDALRVEFCPEYLFDKGRIREHQKALRARWTACPACPGSLPSGRRTVYPRFHLYSGGAMIN